MKAVDLKKGAEVEKAMTLGFDILKTLFSSDSHYL